MTHRSHRGVQSVRRALGLIVLLALVACAGQRAPATGAPSGYALVIDASSSGSRIHILRWRQPRQGALPWIKVAPFPRAAGEPAWSEAIDHELSSYAADPTEAGAALAPLLEYAQQRLDSVGADLGTTRIYLKATAGMRLVPEPEGGRIMAEVRRYLAASPFDLESAEIISGQQEALFGWITVNYMLGLLGDGGPFPTVGALDLGGASTQITFLPLDYPEESAARVVLGGTEYRVYSHSYLGLGQDQALQAVGSPTCYPKGYPIPSGTEGVADGSRGLGDYQACRQAIRDTLSADCTASDCSLMGVYQPPLYGDFFAFSGYGYAASFFGLGQDLSLAALEASGQTYCAEDWEQILRQRPDERGRKYLPAYCFKAAYIVTLLTDGFGFPLTTRRIVTPGRVQGSEVSWVLGSLVYELGGSTH